MFSALAIVNILLEADDFDPKGWIEQMPVSCPECGSANVTEPDEERLRDCLNCGIWFNPAKERAARTGLQESDNAQDEFDFSGYPDTEFNPKGWTQDNVEYLHPRIKTTFSKITWHEDGGGDPDAYDEENGFEDEEGERIEIDDFDREEDIDIAVAAAKWLEQKGASEPSSSQFHPGVWYSTEPQQDMHTGTNTTLSFHLKDFSPEEERKIYYLLFKRTNFQQQETSIGLHH